MLYNLGYVSCSLIVLIIIAYRFFHYKRVNSIRNTFFTFLIYLGILEIVFDIFSSIAISFPDVFSRFVSFFASQFFYLFQFILPFFVFLFVFILTNNPYKYEKYIKICLIPLIISLIVWALNPFLHTVFYLDSANVYHRSYLNLTVYISAGFYLIATSVVSLILKNEMGEKPAHIMVITTVSCLLVTAIQFFYPDVLMTGVGIMISILTMYLYFHNSDSVIDDLTGCFEESALKQYLEGGFVLDEDEYGVALFLKDLKNIDTIFGHDTGYEILKKMGGQLLDIANKHNLDVYHFLGDIFFIICPKKDDYNYVLEELHKTNFRVFNVNNYSSVYLDVKLLKFEGINYYKRKDNLIPIIEFVIDNAMHRNITDNEILVDQKFRDEYDYYQSIELYLHEALNKKLFYMEYQPIYSLKENKYTMLEALIRLNHPTYGRIPPDKFIVVAEQIGIISDITDLVLDMVSDFVSNSNLKELGINNVKINLSAIDLMNNELTHKIKRVISKKNCDILGFEITETVATGLNKEVFKFLEFVKENNLSLSMDDFGSGYANLSSAMKVDFDVIKIDRSMLLAADKSNDSKEVYKTIVKLFKQLNKSIVSEGVETIEEVNYLKEWGIDYIQGYYYSKPLNENDLINFLKNN